MVREIPVQGPFVVGYAHNELFGSTKYPQKYDGEIVKDISSAFFFKNEEALNYAQEGYTVFAVEATFNFKWSNFAQMYLNANSKERIC
ncbi:hypothetical protein EHS13_02140 [Paenibacillus psychroresistens]|uniref:Uncharacterized protein n=1 Tax=Paenibacillus psychroresistens TaxID=1778678 RepID=A0A6B8RCS7_9BACL|nr:hypothetical protein [Paenibacillus psychroresistens]QGQ93787.1 hypothetical protein EHS13_02140 [Paenibacillus psychroresistens]